MKNRFFKLIKNLIGQDTSKAEEPSSSVSKPAPAPAAVPPAPAPAPVPRPQPGVNGIQISLARVLQTLPLEVKALVQIEDAGDRTIAIGLERILPQLARGSVKITFSELRHAAPDVFSASADRESLQITLPLDEILQRLNPKLLNGRRRQQREIEVPDEVSSPFESASQIAASVVPVEEFPAPPASPLSLPGSSRQAPFRSSIQSVPPPAAPTASTPSPTQPGPHVPAWRQNLPLSENGAPSNGNGNAHHRAVSPGMSPSIAFTKPVTPPPAAPTVPPAPVAPPPTPPGPFGSNGHSNGKNGAIPFPAAKAPEPAANPPSPIPMGNTGGSDRSAPSDEPMHDQPFTVKLSALAEGWPESIKRDILELRLVDAQIDLPARQVEEALKQGRILFSWKALRSWIPGNVAAGTTDNDTQVLELPLKLVAPLFLARQSQARKPQANIRVDKDIPNLFFGFPQPEAHPVERTRTDTNFYVWDDASEQVRELPTDPSNSSPGTKFVCKYATPNEVVSRAAGLEGVAGALIALPDGLMVASRISGDLNSDTLAAFLPQIFGKVSQCTRELRMGELNNLNFTVGNVPWKIFRVNSIFFAAFGRAGEPLPTAQLAALAAELNHKQK